MRKSTSLATDEGPTVWEPDSDFGRRETLAAVLKGNPLPVAYRLNYVANFYVGPLVKNMEQTFGLSRPEWIILFCLKRRPDLSAQQISNVSGVPKTSISAAVRQLQNKKLIVRSTDVRDGRRFVLHLTGAGRKIYKEILASFTAREAAMMACLSRDERWTFLELLNKVIANSASWAKPY
jgi:MarR family transcriptional regulator, temperature-dependent positive regulator of motility